MIEIHLDREWVILLVFLSLFVVLTVGVGTSLVIIERQIRRLLSISAATRRDSEDNVKVANGKKG